MNLKQAKSTLLVRSLELVDRHGALLPLAVRDHCTAEAGPPVETAGEFRAAGTLAAAEQDFLARRAALVEAELLRSRPEFALLAAGDGVFTAILVLGLALAFGIGFFSPNVWSDEPLQLLTFPLLWLIAWNLLVYLWLLVSPILMRGAGHSPRPLATLVAGLLSRLRWRGASTGGRRGDSDDAVLAAGVTARFLRDWLPLQRPLAFLRAKILLHAAAVSLTAGMAAGLLLRAVFHEYLAGWETTFSFVDARLLHTVLSVFLGLPSLLTGIAVPDAAQIAGLRQHAGAGGGNAQDWILLYVAAACVYVLLPRMLLWWSGRRQLRRARRDFYLPAADDRYYRRLLQSGRGAGEVAAVLWHALEPAGDLKARVRAALAEELGGRVTLDFLEPVAYGEEDTVLQRLAAHDSRERLVAVFSLAATPEEEVQGELLRQLAAYAAEAPALVLLDAAPLGRFAAAGGYRAHYLDRLRAWERFLDGHHLAHRVLEPTAADQLRQGSSS